jgi:S-adenosylmethionine synthetase
MQSEQKPFRCVRVCAKPLNKGECGRGNQLVHGYDEPSRWISVIAAENRPLTNYISRIFKFFWMMTADQQQTR